MRRRRLKPATNYVHDTEVGQSLVLTLTAPLEAGTRIEVRYLFSSGRKARISVRGPGSVRIRPDWPGDTRVGA